MKYLVHYINVHYVNKVRVDIMEEKTMQGNLIEKMNLFCPNCGKKKLYYIDSDDANMKCINCDEVMTIKGFIFPEYKKRKMIQNKG